MCASDGGNVIGDSYNGSGDYGGDNGDRAGGDFPAASDDGWFIGE